MSSSAIGPIIAAVAAWTNLAFADESPPRGNTIRPAFAVEVAEPAVFTLQQLTAIALERNPALSQAAFRIDAARGRAIQAGLYPNPVLSVTGDELGDRTGPAGIWTAPQLSQEIVTGGKRRLSQEAATKEADQASFALTSQKFSLLGEIRQAYYDALALQTRAAILDELIELAEKSVLQTKRLLEAQQGSRLEVVQLEVERERLIVERESVLKETPFALRRLAAVVGAPDLAILRVDGAIDEYLPYYDHQVARFVIWNHPDVQAARLGAERARVLVERARAEPIPNVTLSTGYTRQNQNRSNDWLIGVSMPIPAFNRNQGNIRAAIAECREATAEVDRVENNLQDKLAAAFREYSSSKQRASRYQSSMLPRAQESYELSVKAYQGGQFEYLRVVEAQRTVAQVRLELIKALSDAWKAAAAISALMVQEEWPHPPIQAPTK